MQIVVNGFFLQSLCQENSYTLALRLMGTPPKTLFPPDVGV